MNLFLLLPLIFALNVGFAQKINTKRLDSLLNALESNNSCWQSLAISKNGNLIYQKATGFRYLSDSKNLKANVQTKYKIASNTKIYTAVMVFQLMEEEKLNLHNTLDEYFPTIENAKEITIEHLLNHHSGIHNYTQSPEIKNWEAIGKTKKEMVEIISGFAPDFPPGTQASYSNSNYLLLGYILEAITKQSYKNLLRNKITKKAGLKDTYYGGKTNIHNNESFSYEFDGSWKQVPETHMSIPGGAGAIVSSAADMSKFIYSLFEGSLLKKKSLDKMKALTDGYGMGLIPISYYDKECYGSRGRIDGFNSMVTYFLDDSIAISYCSNQTLYHTNPLFYVISDIIFDQHLFHLPSSPPALSYSFHPDNLTCYEGYYKFIPKSGKAAYFQIFVRNSQLYLKELWSGNEIKFNRHSKLEFFNMEIDFPLIFTKDEEGRVHHVQTFKTDIWKRIDNYEPEIENEFFLDTFQVKELIGFFQSENNSDAVITVSMTGNRMSLHPSWEAKPKIYIPNSDCKFVIADTLQNEEVTIVKDTVGKVEKMITQDGVWNKVLHYKPLAEIKLSKEQLGKYEGMYSFKFPEKEKEDFIHIKVEGGELMLKEAWNFNAGRNYIPLSETHFFSKYSPFSLQFSKDTSGNISQVLILFPYRQDLWKKCK